MKKGWSSMLIVVALGAAVFLAVLWFMSGLRHTTKVVVAAKSLAVGTRLQADDVKLQEVHASDALPNAITSIEQAVGQVLTVGRMPGDQITGDMIGEKAISGLAASTPPDHRIMAVSVDLGTGVGGYLRPGDKVEVVGILDTKALASTLMEQERAGIGVESGSMSRERKETLERARSLAAALSVSRVVLRDLTVVAVPSDFRRHDTSNADSSEFMPVENPISNEGIILLSVPEKPMTLTVTAETLSPTEANTLMGAVAPPARSAMEKQEQEPSRVLVASPVEVLALLNKVGTIYLVMEPVGREAVPTNGVSLEQLTWFTTPITNPVASKEEQR